MKILFTTEDCLSMVKANGVDIHMLVREGPVLNFNFSEVDKLTAGYVHELDRMVKLHLPIFDIGLRGDIPEWVMRDIREYLYPNGVEEKSENRSDYMRNANTIPISFKCLIKGDLAIIILSKENIKVIGTNVTSFNNRFMDELIRTLGRKMLPSVFYKSEFTLQFMDFKTK